MTSLSSQLPDTPNSMVPSPAETWERLLVCSPRNHENSSYHGHGKLIPLPSPERTGNRGTVFPKNPSKKPVVTLSEIKEVKLWHSRSTLNEGPCSLEMDIRCSLWWLLYLWFWTFFWEKIFSKDDFRRWDFFSLEDHLCLWKKLSYCYLLSHQFAKNKSAQKMCIYICECKMLE